MKHSPFQSSYLQDFVILEERQGKRTLYPRTDQLPLLARALRWEFLSMLPHRIARVDARSTGYHKIERSFAAEGFCRVINASRPDGLLLTPLLDEDGVDNPAIIQQITEETPRGPRHWFKFYRSEDFFTEIFLCGRRVIFTGHAVDRFSIRGPAFSTENVRNLLFGTLDWPLLAFPYANGTALFPAFAESVIALPYTEGQGELIVSTCLGINEVHSFPDLMIPVIALNPHYGTRFKLPRIRTWSPSEHTLRLKRIWELKIKASGELVERAGRRWGDVAARVPDMVRESGHGPGSRLVFLDHIPGPCCHLIRPGEEEPHYDEWADYKKQAPDVDWEKQFQGMDQWLTVTEETRSKSWPVI